MFSEEMGAKYSSFITSNSSCFSSDTPRLAAGQFIYEQFLKKKYKIIFEEELAAWMGDPNLWPKNRDYKKFKKWFEIIPSDALFVFGDDPIVLEEY
jgi:hypothetical protein